MRQSRVISNSGASSSQQAGDSGAAPGQCKAPRVTPNDFELLRVVGQGSFGKVHFSHTLC